MKLYLSPIAEERLIDLLDFLSQTWGVKSRNVFLNKFLKKTQQILLLPKRWPQSSEIDNLYKCVVTSQTTFYYRIQDDEIQIVTLFDSRQDPDKLDKDL